MVAQHKRIGAVHARDHGRLFHRGDHLAGHLLDDLIGISVSEQPAQGSTTGHSVAAGVVDYNEVDTSGFFTLCRHASASAGADNALSERYLGSERFKNRGTVGHGGS